MFFAMRRLDRNILFVLVQSQIASTTAKQKLSRVSLHKKLSWRIGKGNAAVA